MKIHAKAYSKNTGIIHLIADRETKLIGFDGTQDGSVKIGLPTRPHINLTGEYTLTIDLSVDEVNQIIEASYAGPLKARIKELEGKLAYHEILKMVSAAS
jgi:hypothetical protein